ncbi:Polyketide synthase enoylreductase [Penicillium bovifimosum]|uniref:Polyketide synthase enoylreductase n=1 Tax=Penicillium bovifimosum TaxID=126998 RepID=A0A9W9GHA3_9EURO|nr:Polyketide synthase enoylreductase [Penicillium bovifimosum]KAJ5120483.1 Polyketide synthase enoylreductase [Penicillium bovifimosum]
MKAVQIQGDASSPRVVINPSMDIPKPRNDELLIRVHAAGITGDEILWPEPYLCATRIPGHDISGVVFSTGPQYHGPLKIGQDVFALLSADRGQGQADYVICLPKEVAPKPESLSHEEAAALPIPLLTAWEAIESHINIRPGMRVLVTGASGAVGIMAVQLASQLAGANVVALSSSRHHDMLKHLGAQEVLDYNTSDWNRQTTDVDCVLDTVGGDILTQAWSAVKEDGIIVTVGDPAPAWAYGRGVANESVDRPHVRYVHFIVSPNSERLAKASDMIDSGHLKPLPIKPFIFNEAVGAWAYARQRNRGHKAVIDFVRGYEGL